MTWTAETIYTDAKTYTLVPPPYPRDIDRRRRNPVFTPEFLAAIDAETEWVPVGEVPSLSSEQTGAFADPNHVCPVCQGSLEKKVLMQGKATGIVTKRSLWCDCRPLRMFWKYWSKVPLRYRDVRLHTTQPSTLVNMPLDRQAAILKIICKNADNSMLLAGDAKTGKTHLMLGLYRRALESRARQWVTKPGTEWGLWRVNTSVWLEEQVRDSMAGRDEDVPIPDLTVRKITQAALKGVKPRLFLEEIDKFKPSEFKMNRLFEIVNAVYEADGQIVATSNTSPEQLANEWGNRYGSTILRRIGDEPDGLTLKFSNS